MSFSILDHGVKLHGKDKNLHVLHIYFYHDTIYNKIKFYVFYRVCFSPEFGTI